ncbi:hypothetical protein DM01DRAFT_326677 [Hesseltinella vesiculosa]|uniref:Cyclin N-terminal domain-containing protein n=1 Tax=Hesseltinella vesiculosa TaxID=101127 RepID=A0A1X2GF97_9FUNG|nr:hypothetical protein DM01DRAFT_326677 [Hesseltinella vesiculosa]
MDHPPHLLTLKTQTDKDDPTGFSMAALLDYTIKGVFEPHHSLVSFVVISCHPLPSIPDNLVQPLREALPKLDQALSSTVPSEAVPLCQQLFHTWLLTHQQDALPPPPRAKTAMSIAAMYPSPMPPSSNSTSSSSPPSHLHPAPAPAHTVSNDHYKKGQANSRQWFPFNTKRKPSSVAPMLQDQGSDEKKNISDDYPHQPAVWTGHVSASTSTSSAATINTASTLQPQRYRRNISFILSKLGTKMRHWMQSQKALPALDHRQPVRNMTAPDLSRATVSIAKLPTSHTYRSDATDATISMASPANLDSLTMKKGSLPVELVELAKDPSLHSQMAMQDELDDSDDSADDDSIGPMTSMVDKDLYLSAFSRYDQLLQKPHPDLQSQQSRTDDPGRGPAGYASFQSVLPSHITSSLHQDDPPFNFPRDRLYDIPRPDHADAVDDANLKTPWSPPSSLANKHRALVTTSKTESAIDHEPSVPYLRHGIKRGSVDLNDQIQYTTRSLSSASFALNWQQSFHDLQQPRERIAITLKSVAWSLYDIMRRNHRSQRFTSDTAYVTYPDIKPSDYNEKLFSAKPTSEWRDVFNQMAYVFDKGELTSEHAIITMIYIDRMLENTKQQLCEVNWRLILLAGLITCVKVWDDCAVYNLDFVQIFPELDIQQVNMIERRFLEHIDWNVSVRCSLFASTYFELREYQ